MLNSPASRVRIRSLECRNDRTLVLFVDEVLDRIGVERLHEGLNLGTILIALADDEDVDVRRGLVLHEEGIARRNEVRLHRPVRVDDGDVYVIKGAGQLRRFDLFEIQMLRIVDDILDGCCSADAVLELQQTCTLEEEQGASAVGRIRSGWRPERRLGARRAS